MPPDPLSLADFARLPADGDNVAIATRRVEAGTAVLVGNRVVALSHTVLEGHRFAVRVVRPGEPLLSWGLPFGVAVRVIAPGEYVANASILAALAVRDTAGAVLPTAPNFLDWLEPYRLDEAALRPAPPVALAAAPATFSGYRRRGRRGVGTRNTVVILGTSSRTAAFARQLASRLQPLARVFPGLDGIVAIAHTEGGGQLEPNNAAEVLRALAGFMVHPNVGAVLAVDYGVEPVTNARLRTFMMEQGYPLGDVLHEFLSIREGHAAALAAGERHVRAWLPLVAGQTRTTEPLSALRIALQCGGSDAFSGVSGNPLAGAVAHEVIRHGGSANLCETDEAFGGEAYLLQNVRDLPTAQALLATLAGFRERLAWHGVTAESNPSGGNKLRGLYNISLKSLGAVHKKDPRTRLDYVIRYADRMDSPGFYFMDSPGNDLEGIAGQVAAGCNLFIFVTGNGSVTNFPFVPTVKVTTTTRRHNLLANEMDVNAGRYLDGEPMPVLVAEMFGLLIATASGRRTKGERAGHSQVSLWRDWRQTDTSCLAALRARPEPAGRPLPTVLAPGAAAPAHTFPAWQAGDRCATELIGLVLPTSMCSSQIARIAAERLNNQIARFAGRITRFVALPHTEGCGFGGASMHDLLHRTYCGYATHPNVVAALFLEHGCEKIPNDVVRNQLEQAGIASGRFGWVSVQLDGGMDRAINLVEAWFGAPETVATAPVACVGDWGTIGVGLQTAGPVAAATAGALARVASQILVVGGSVLVPESDALLANPDFLTPLLGSLRPYATLAYGQTFSLPGLHVVATETDHWVENLTGLGGCGVQIFLTVVRDHAQPTHPFLPVVQTAESGAIRASGDIDLGLSGDAVTDSRALLDLATAVLRRQRTPATSTHGLHDFQLTRGLLGVSA